MGPRQSGKTTLVQQIRYNLEKEGKTSLYFNCDLEEDLRRIDTFSLTALNNLTSARKYLFIDEAQRLSDPGRTLKIVHDNLPNVKILATGSSSLDIKNKLSDALTGRYIDFTLYPFSFFEATAQSLEYKEYLTSEAIMYGFYPEVYLAKEIREKIVFLDKILESYLFKDILAFQKVRQPQVLKDLTRAISYQIGSEINENELANRLKIDRKTIVNYLDLLEQTFVIVKVFPFSQNPRREIGRNYKIYFTDLGIRNALIGDFNQLSVRQDSGQLWENFLFMERLKKFANRGEKINYNFWRSYSGAEVDYLERKTDSSQISAYEFKAGIGKLSKGAGSFQKQYHVPVKLINKDNYLKFIVE